jgi:hypothetical protein
MSPELDTFKRYQGGAIQGAWSGCFQGYRGDAMQDLGYELRRIPLPRTPVNNASTRLLWYTWSFFWVAYCWGRKEIRRDE